MVNLLYFYGMCGLVKEALLQRYFSEELRCGRTGESDIVQACRRSLSQLLCIQLLNERQSNNVTRFLQTISKRYDLSEGFKKLRCRTLIFVGENSPFHEESSSHAC